MKRLLTIAALCASSGCVPNQGGSFLHFTTVRGFASGATAGACSTDSTKTRIAGALDVAGNDSYLMAVSVQTTNASQPVSVGNVNYQGAGLSDVTLYEIDYSYTLSDASTGITLPKDESLPIYAVFTAAADPASNYLLFEGIGPQALSALQQYYRAHPNSSVTVVSQIKAKAYLSGGNQTESNVFRFPITIFASSYDAGSGKCKTSGEMAGGGSVCGSLGQDAPICYVPSAPPTTSTADDVHVLSNAP